MSRVAAKAWPGSRENREQPGGKSFIFLFAGHVRMRVDTSAKDMAMHHNVLTPARLLILTVLSITLLALTVPVTQTRAEQEQLVYLPLAIKHGATLPPTRSPTEQARDRINYYRGLAGVQLLELHPALIQAAQNHANYTTLNATDQSAWSYGPHGEVAGKPGFSGQWPPDRGTAAQFPYLVNDEVIAPYDHPTRAVDAWINTVFHRINLLDPKGQYMGYGHGRDSRGYGVDVVDIGKGAADPAGEPRIIVYPSPGTSNIPLFGAGEDPDPIPPDGHYPIGYPITIQPLNTDNLTVTHAELRNNSGALVAVYPNPPLCVTYHCYAIIPSDPLTPSMAYTIHVVGDVDGTAFDKTWSFTTTACTMPGFC
jgi:uncharacterized protein YkwD